MKSNSVWYCEICGNQMKSSAKFCEVCGHPAAETKSGKPGAASLKKSVEEQPMRSRSGEEAVFPKAPITKRYLAFLIDAFIGGLVFCISTAIFLTNTMNVGFSVVFGHRMEDSTLYLIILFSFIWMVFYGLSRDGLFGGRSIGKVITGMRVIQLENGQPCDSSKSLIRNLTGLISIILPVFILIEAISLASNPFGQRIGDRWANTQVVESGFSS